MTVFETKRKAQILPAGMLMMDVPVVRARRNNSNTDDTDDADSRGFFRFRVDIFSVLPGVPASLKPTPLAALGGVFASLLVFSFPQCRRPSAALGVFSPTVCTQRWLILNRM